MVLPNITRRLFMKGIGALAGKAAMPKAATNLLPDVKEAVKMDSAPWINSMVNAVKNVVDSGKSISLKSGAKINYLKKPRNEYEGHTLSVKTADGRDDIITFKEGKNDIDIKFEVADDFHNNQHIYVDKKAKTTEIIDENYYMTSPEDYAKDDPIIWDMNKKNIREKMILDKTTKPDDYMYDYMSVPEDSGYEFMWERYVDSFSPSGNIFRTKQLADKERARNLLQKEMSEMDWESQFRGASMHGYNKGGIVDVLPPLDPQEYAVGGIVKGALKAVPKILGKGKPYMEKLMAPKGLGKGPDLSRVRTDLYTPPKGPYTITNESGARVLDRDFKTLKEAQDALKEMVEGFKTQDATTFRIFGKRPPKTAEGVSEGAPEVNLGMVGKKMPKEDTPAMFWRSREEIYEAPQERMAADQWLGYLKARGIRPTELDDSSLEPYLRSLGNKKLTKKELLKEFDEIAPEMEVVPLGKGSAEQTINNVYKNVKKMDADAFDPKVGGMIKYLQGAMPSMVKGGRLDEKAAKGIATNVDDYMFKNFGIKDSLAEGIAQGSGVPFNLKYPLINLASAFNRRGVSFQPKAYARAPNYGGQQVLGGGDNTQEFLFKYKPGKLRTSEPTYTYSHDFGLTSSQRANAFVHVRTTDRTDEFGRRMLFVEEIQSDMHQPLQRALREGGKDVYARRADKIVVDDNMKHLAAIQSRIEEILAVNPASPALKKLYSEREKVRKIVSETVGKSGGDVPQGPFAKSQDYMEFVSKYLTRVAKDGNYDGVGFSSPAIKNRSLTMGERNYLGNEAAYGPILGKALKSVEKKSNAKLIESVIMDDTRRPWRIPFLSIKDPVAQETIGKGLPLYKKGGLAKKGI